MRKRSKLGKEIAKWRRKCDDAYQVLCRLIYGIKCEVCGKSASEAHHFIAKSLSNALRYEVKNGVMVCRGCHQKLTFTGDPEIQEKIIKKRGQRWFNWLKQNRHNKVKINLNWYKAQCSILDNLIELWKQKKKSQQTPF